ncbi:MAG TPA: hypothetical protein VJ695_03740 [Nitrososphaera sp.]|nr:hypothetical protein [Nitrososphaera sp.]
MSSDRENYCDTPLILSSATHCSSFEGNIIPFCTRTYLALDDRKE